jgi:sulfite reductase (NADPH) flavoprotein alpha-component
MANRSVKSVCPYCGVGCGIVMEVSGNRVVKVTGDKTHPANFGRLCTKGSSCHQAIADSGRLEHAYVRADRRQEPARCDMDAAIQETAERLRAILEQHGPDALAFYVSGQMSLEAQYLANKLAKGFIGTKHIESNSRLCMASAGSGYKLSLGSDAPPGSYQDFDHADVFFVIGANMADCHPILFLRMMDRVKAGAQLIVVDPRRNATADKADLFLQIKPGTDLALLNGLLHLFVKNGHTDPGFIAEYTEGWDVMPAFLEDYTPEAVSELTGLSEASIRKAAEWIGTSANWMSCWTMGLNQSTHGTWHTNAICNLHLATGAICRLGSGPFSLTGQPNAMGGREMGYMGSGLPGQRSVLIEQDRAFVEKLWGLEQGALRTDTGDGTVALFDDLQKGLVKACWIICTNPVATVPNRKNVIAGLQAAELVIAQDAFLDTETNRYADILLPGALWSEAEGVMINSERNLTLMQKAVEPPGEAMADWQIIARVACAMGYQEAFSYNSAEEVFEEIKQTWNPITGYDLRGTSYGRLRITPLQWPCASDKDNDRNPLRYLNDGISQSVRFEKDGEKPRLVFATETGKAVFWARPYLPPNEMPDGIFPFVLNTGRLQHQWHTMTKTRGVPTLNKLNPGPFIEIHPEDALALSIQNKDPVEIRSRRGSAVLSAVVTERVRPGNCFAPFHWNDVFGDKLAINAVTHDAVDPISQQPECKFSAVALKRIAVTQSLPMTDSKGRGVIADAAAGAPPIDCKVNNMKQIDALAKLFGLEDGGSIRLDADEQTYMTGYLGGLRLAETIGGIPYVPQDAPLQEIKRHFINGLLAGLFARTGHTENITALLPGLLAESLTPASDIVTILWASQTGTAEMFAEQCAQRLKSAGHTVRLVCMDSFAVSELARVSRLLVITSTFGDGDPPDNGSNFWTGLQSEDMPELNSLSFSVLAFGDSSYGQFCGFGKLLDARLETLGGHRLVARVDCEPDYDEAGCVWLESILQSMPVTTDNNPLPQTAFSSAGDDSEEEPATLIEPSPGYDRKNPFRARMILNRRLNAEGSEKDVRQIGFDLTGSGLCYEAGDALGVWHTNCSTLVEEILAALKLCGATSVEVKGHGEMPLTQALLRHYEITRITTEVLQCVLQHSHNEVLANILADGNKLALQQWLWDRQIVDLLYDFPIQVAAAEWLTALKPLQPRLYSISSSPKAFPEQVHLTVSALRYRSAGKLRGGACSTFLADRAAECEVPVFVQKSPHFRPPRNPDTDMIMVGPGTGIAPFLAFLQERQAIGAKGRNWLFFGEQHAEKDFYYRDELETLQKLGMLHRLDTAFSRDQNEKIYVQQRMMEKGAELWSWLEGGGYFYVCGDASRMAKDVDTALREIVQCKGGMGSEAAKDYVAKMIKDKRYLRDVY